MRIYYRNTYFISNDRKIAYINEELSLCLSYTLGLIPPGFIGVRLQLVVDYFLMRPVARSLLIHHVALWVRSSTLKLPAAHHALYMISTVLLR